MAALFRRIIPILFVGNLETERDFYLRLGFRVTYSGPEYPYFISLGHGPVEFGLELRRGFSPSDPYRVLTWQFGISDLDEAKEVFDNAGIAYQEVLMAPAEDWQYRVLRARTPNGYHLLLEEGSG